MSSDATRTMHKERARELATIGIVSTTNADHEASRQAWQDALAYAEQHLPGDDITYWIRSGLGAALLEVGDYHGALEMAGSALEWCASQQAPLASLTMAKSLLQLGDVTRAREYVRQACGLRGDHVLHVFSPADRSALGQIALSDSAAHASDRRRPHED